MAETGHQNIQASFDQIVNPIPPMFPPTPNTPGQLGFGGMRTKFDSISPPR